MNLVKIFCMACLFLWIASALAFADGEETPTRFKLSIHNIYTNTFPNNELLVTLRDQGGRARRNVSESNLALEENGQSLPFVLEPIVNGSVGLIILIDSSESLGGFGKSWKLDLAKATVAQLLSELRPGDGALIIDFDLQPHLLAPFSRDRQSLQGSLSKIKAGGGTALYDGVLYALHLAKRLPTKRKAIVLITDGNEQASKTTINEALQSATQSRLPVIALDFSHEAEDFFLQSLAYKTKGVYQHLPQQKVSITSQIYRAHADAWKLSYASPQSQRDGSIRSVQLSYIGSGAALALATKEYQAPATDLVSCAPNLANKSVLEIGSVEGSVGKIFRIPIGLKNTTTGLSSFDLTIDFDPGVIKMLALESPDYQSDLTAIELDPSRGRVRLAGRWETKQSETEIILGYLNVEIVGAAGRRTELLVSAVHLLNQAGHALDTLSINGVVSVTGAQLGDVNGDGKTDLADAFRIASYASGHIHALALNLDVADTNRDGAITMDDAWAIILGRVSR